MQYRDFFLFLILASHHHWLKTTCAKNTTATRRQKYTQVPRIGTGNGRRLRSAAARTAAARRRLLGGGSTAARRRLGRRRRRRRRVGQRRQLGRRQLWRRQYFGQWRHAAARAELRRLGRRQLVRRHLGQHPVEEHEEEVGLMVPGTGGSLHPDVAAAASRSTRHTCGPQVSVSAEQSCASVRLGRGRAYRDVQGYSAGETITGRSCDAHACDEA